MKNSEKATVLLNDIADLFSRKEFAGTCAKAFINAPDVPSSSWSLGNQILMLFSGTTDARGYLQWQKVGRHVKKGVKAIYILVPMQKKVNCNNNDNNDNKKHENKEEEGTKKTITIGFRGMPVFRYEDTEGTPLTEYTPKTFPPLFGLAEKNGIDVRWKKSHHGEYGSINLDSKNMTLSTESPDTYLHELVHWYDNKNVKLRPGQNPEEETVAQLGACVLAKMYGYDSEKYTWNYIASYVGSKSPQDVGQMCFRVLGRVQKAILAILKDAESLSQVMEITASK